MKQEAVKQPSTGLNVFFIFDESQLSFDRKEDPNPPNTEFGPQDKIVTPYDSLSSTDYIYEARIINHEGPNDHNGKVRFLVLRGDGTIVREFLLWIDNGAPQAGTPTIAVTLDKKKPQTETEPQTILIGLAGPPQEATILGGGGGWCGCH